jgi:glycosyltransferase involved in cell wall biosynthesis
MRVLHVIPDLGYSGAAKQLSLLASRLPRDRFETRVCVLKTPGPYTPILQAAGLTVEALGWTRPLDPRPLWRLRRLLRTWRPEVIHAWRPASLRTLLLAGERKIPLVVSAALTAGARGPQLSRLDRWLLRRADQVLAPGSTQAHWLRHFGIGEEKLTLVRPAVDPSPAPSSQLIIPNLPSTIVCAGPLEPHKGYRDAIWAFDILLQVHQDLHLFLAGTGSDRERLEQFARAVGLANQVHFLGEVADLTGQLTQAEIVWIPSLTQGGINVALEAQALGRPVVASRIPELQEVVTDGENGFLVPSGDKTALARQTRRLLEDADLRRQMGEAGRRRVGTCFAPEELVQRVSGVYEDLAA